MNSDSRISVAVVGVGYAGRLHAEKYAASSEAKLVGVVDIDDGRARELGKRLGVPSMTDYHDLFGKARCVSVAVPTKLHFEVAGAFLKQGIDVLVEKPMTATLDEGRRLVALARDGARILQVGHLERFNPAIRALEKVIREPKFVECHRLAPFVERGTDVDVVLDLMIHDIDVIASLVRAPVRQVDAVGVPVLTDKPDIANARITFANGCVANVTASRVSMKRERKIRIFQSDAYVSIDYDQKRAQIYHKPAKGASWMDVRGDTIEIKEGDALGDQLDSFLECVRSRATPLISGEEGLRALEIAASISERL